MSIEKFPIGTDLTVKKEHKLKGFTDNEDIIQVKEGDRVLITKSGLKYLTGAAKGNLTINEHLIDRTNYDIDNITLRITEAIIAFLGEDFKEFMDWHDIKKQELFDEILNELDYFI